MQAARRLAKYYVEHIFILCFYPGAAGAAAETAEAENPEDTMGDKKNLVGVANSTSRRRMILGATIAFGGVAMGSLRAWAGEEQEISHGAESIHQEPVFRASRKRVYEALTETKQFDKLTHLSAAMQSGMSLGNKPTEISWEEGGTFTLFRRAHRRTAHRVAAQ